MVQNRSSKPVHIVHVIGSLVPGGAELVLARLLEGVDSETFPATVISLTDKEGLGQRIEAAGVQVYELGMKKGIRSPGAFLGLYRLLKNLQPDVIQSWLYHANFLCSLMKVLMPGKKLIWSIRHTKLGRLHDKSLTILLARLSAVLSFLPDRIVYCSQESASVHAALGYSRKRAVFIPNGYDTKVYSPQPELRAKSREKWGVSEGKRVIGFAGRFHPAKDINSFLKAAAQLHLTEPAGFVLCGRGMDRNNQELAARIADLGLSEEVLLLGEQGDMPAFYNSLDVFALTSISEAFPNVVAEAMACGVPCVVTDVGDAALIVGDSGIVVPPRDTETMAAGWLKLIGFSAAERESLGISARKQIVTRYSMGEMVRRYEELYRVV
ncbi:MAG: glycosyltransferase [Anaerolineales bacterium]|nr:glycosyltransferase [Anaerolineales bacterium]